MPSTASTAIRNESFDQERALYGISHTTLENVRFAGPADGESALKECRDVAVRDATFELRYPLWHDDGVRLQRAEFAKTSRAALWYTRGVRIADSRLLGPKALRECDDVTIEGSEVVSEEFGWSCRGVTLRDSSLSGDYAFLHASDLHLANVTLSGKYSFQYVEGLVIEGGTLDTKDAFWHARNVTVHDATLKGEYLGWYSDGLTLVNCRIEGTQPLVRCTNLTLIDCEMAGCDLAFEGSDVYATILGRVDSIRDPKSGRIKADVVGEIVHDTLAGCGAQIATREGTIDAMADGAQKGAATSSEWTSCPCSWDRVSNRPIRHSQRVRNRGGTHAVS